MTFIEKQRMQIVLDDAFFANLILPLKLVESTEFPTMATDAETLWVNPEFVLSIPPAEVQGVLVHEALHCGLGHPWRLAGLDQKIANEAADIVVNNIIDEYNKTNNNRYPLPTGAVRRPELNGKSFDEVYVILKTEKSKQQTPQPKPQDSPSSGDGDSAGMQGAGNAGKPQDGEEQNTGDTGTGCPTGVILPRKDTPDTPTGTTQADWAMTLARSALQAQQQGRSSALIKRLVGEATAPAVTPWQVVLRPYLNDLSRSGYDWMRPNRRYTDAGFYFPSRRSKNAAGSIAVGIDTSGSMRADLVQECLNEAQDILETLHPRCLHVVYCDAAVNGVFEYFPGDRIQAEPLGGGGTDFRPIFDHVLENLPDCKILVVLSRDQDMVD